jgi:hypothetical protein
MSDAWRSSLHDLALLKFLTSKKQPAKRLAALFWGEIQQTRWHPQNPRQTTLYVLQA